MIPVSDPLEGSAAFHIAKAQTCAGLADLFVTEGPCVAVAAAAAARAHAAIAQTILAANASLHLHVTQPFAGSSQRIVGAPATCDGCGVVYVPSRQPRPGRRSFCPECRGEGVPLRKASADARARRKTAQ